MGRVGPISWHHNQNLGSTCSQQQATRDATSGFGDMAIAIGPNSNAVVDGAGSDAVAQGEFDTSFVDGTDSQAVSGLRR
jgi:hypothetical protein